MTGTAGALEIGMTNTEIVNTLRSLGNSLNATTVTHGGVELENYGDSLVGICEYVEGTNEYKKVKCEGPFENAYNTLKTLPQPLVDRVCEMATTGELTDAHLQFVSPTADWLKPFVEVAS